MIDRVFLTTGAAVGSAATTTLPIEDEQILIAGASGFAAQERVQDEATRYIPRRLREWADARLKEFETGLHRLARRLAAKHSGLAFATCCQRILDDAWVLCEAPTPEEVYIAVINDLILIGD